MKPVASQARRAADFLESDFANSPEVLVPLIKRWNFPTYQLSFFSIIVHILPSAEGLCLDSGDGHWV